MHDQKAEPDWIEGDELYSLFYSCYMNTGVGRGGSWDKRVDEFKAFLRKKRAEDMKESWGEALSSDLHYPYKTGPKWQSFEEFFDEFKKRSNE